MRSGIFGSIAAAAAAVALPAKAGTLIDGASIFSIQGNAPTVGFFDGDTLAPSSGFGVGMPIDGLTYLDGKIYVSGVQSTGILSGGYLKSYDLDGTFQDFEYGASFTSWGPIAAGAGSVFAAANSGLGSGSSLQTYDANLEFQSAFAVPDELTGLAFAGGSLFASYGSILAHYSLAGDLIGAHDFGVVDITGLAYGANKVFAAFASGSLYGWAAIDPTTFLSGGATVYTDDPVTGLAFGDGGLFVSTEFTLAKYDLAGLQSGGLTTGPVISNGPLAFIPSQGPPRDPCEPGTRVCDPGGAVPEPGAWALMILGFGMSGAILRVRRRRIAFPS